MSKTKKRLIIIGVILGVFVALGLFFGLIFNVKSVEVDFATSTNRVESYQKEDVLKASGIKKGSNLLFANYSNNINKLEKEFPFARFEVVRTFPNRVIIYIYERKPVFRVEDDAGFWQIYDEHLKCLEIVSKMKISENNNDKQPIIKGVNLDLCEKEGEFINNPDFENTIDQILDGVYGVERTDISILSSITFKTNTELNQEYIEFKIGLDNEGTKVESTLVVLNSKYNLTEKVAEGVYIYLSEVSNNPIYVGKLDDVVIRVAGNFDKQNRYAGDISTSVNE